MINANDPQSLHAQAMVHLLPHVLKHGLKDEFDAEIVAYVTSTLVRLSVSRSQNTPSLTETT
jgi:hypothetical protein